IVRTFADIISNVFGLVVSLVAVAGTLALLAEPVYLLVTVKKPGTDFQLGNRLVIYGATVAVTLAAAVTSRAMLKRLRTGRSIMVAIAYLFVTLAVLSAVAAVLLVLGSLVLISSPTTVGSSTRDTTAAALSVVLVSAVIVLAPMLLFLLAARW